MDRFYTRHEVFDEIVRINYGSSILVLDESFMEARNLLLVLLKEKTFELVPRQVETSNGQILAMGEVSLSDASVVVNKLRSDCKGSIIIHRYFPDFLIRYEAGAFLRLIESWHNHIKDNKTIEFYLLPKGAFPEVEKKMMSIVNGGIEVKVKREGKGFDLSFIVIRSCKPEYHLQEFRYRLEGSKVFIEWEGEYRDKLPRVTSDEIKNRIEDYKRDLPFLRIEVDSGVPVSLSNRDYWLLSQVRDADLISLKILFYDRFDEVLEKIARWHIMGYIRVVKGDKKYVEESDFTIGKKISWKSKLALKLPLKFTLNILRASDFRTVPLDVYVAEKRALFEFLKIFFGDRTELNIESLDNILEMEERFHEMVGRIKALKDIKKLEKDAGIVIDMKYFSKIIKMVLQVSYKLDCNIEKVSPTTFLIKVDDCFLCEGLESIRPVCRAISGALTGACSLSFKCKIDCKETQCKALGNDSCVFKLTIAK
ncbi:MAG: hypothetical protein L6M37_06655 [Candidatus Methylarchaceae archaeon HK02M1]|nr:hypothetical protein [Candidatus Methylarchaceae archaeon HK02M1]